MFETVYEWHVVVDDVIGNHSVSDLLSVKPLMKMETGTHMGTKCSVLHIIDVRLGLKGIAATINASFLVNPVILVLR